MENLLIVRGDYTAAALTAAAGIGNDNVGIYDELGALITADSNPEWLTVAVGRSAWEGESAGLPKPQSAIGTKGLKALLTPYRAEVKGVQTVTIPAGTTIVEGTVFTLIVARKGAILDDFEKTQSTYSVYAKAGDTVNGLVTELVAQITRDKQAIVTATGAANVITLTGKAGYDFKTLVYDAIRNATVTISTAYVPSSASGKDVVALFQRCIGGEGITATHPDQDGLLNPYAQKAVADIAETDQFNIISLYYHYNATRERNLGDKIQKILHIAFYKQATLDAFMAALMNLDIHTDYVAPNP